MKIPREYQSRMVGESGVMLGSGIRKIILQLSTGGGKTFIASMICNQFLRKNPGKRILILVHRIELLKQMRKTLYNDFGIAAHPLKAGTRWIPDVNIYVGMVDSVYNRLNRLPPIDLVFIDECHLANFFRMHTYFDRLEAPPLVIGMTATPISSNKKKPLKNYYQEIVCGPPISQLIADGALCQNLTYAPSDIVNRAEVALKSNGDFDEQDMGNRYRLPRFVDNTVKAYERFAKGCKTIVFNVNVEHSKAVNDAFIAAGYNARHLDGTETSYRRAATLKWFEDTPGAILNNVAITTTGTDIPSVECILFNKMTKSVTLWLQATGRGGRPTPYKAMFKIIDMGGNAITLGDWSSDRDWAKIFHHPPRAKDEPGVAPCKSCPDCDAIVPASIAVCPYCGYNFPTRAMEIEEELKDFVVVTRGIDVPAMIAANEQRKLYYTFFEIGRKLAEELRATTGPRSLTDERAEFAVARYHELAKQWCHANGKRFNKWHQDRARETMYDELEKRFKWMRPEAQDEARPALEEVLETGEPSPEPLPDPVPAVIRPLSSLQPLNLMNAI